MKFMLSVVPKMPSIWLCGSVKHFLCEALFKPISIYSLFFFSYYTSPLASQECVRMHAALRGQNMHINTCMHRQTCKHTRQALKRRPVEWISVWFFEEKTWKCLLCLEQRFVWSFSSMGPGSSSLFWSSYKIRFSSAAFFLAADCAVEPSSTLLCT